MGPRSVRRVCRNGVNLACGRRLRGASKWRGPGGTLWGHEKQACGRRFVGFRLSALWSHTACE
eukprot:5275438-Pyramimonas_sp.AAC.1